MAELSRTNTTVPATQNNSDESAPVSQDDLAAIAVENFSQEFGKELGKAIGDVLRENPDLRRGAVVAAGGGIGLGLCLVLLSRS